MAVSQPSMNGTSPVKTCLEDLTLPVSTNWKELERVAKEIKQFFESIDQAVVGTGLMYYDKENFTLKPRSNWVNNHTYQWVVTIGNKSATFEAIQESFTDLIGKISLISQRIHEFNPEKERCCAAQDLLVALIRIQLIIDGVARAGLLRLAQNYTDAWKPEKSASILALSRESFTMIEKVKALLTEKMLPHVPGLDVTITLESYAFSAKALLENRDLYRANLRSIVSDPVKGLLLPPDLVGDALGDSKHISKPNRDALRIAAQFISLPSMAQPIPSQGGATLWLPMRLLKSNGEGVIQQGVWGTCERSANSADNICNVYFRITPDTRQIGISCGTLNSLSKAEQLAEVMKETLTLVPEANGRWVVHQLNSFRHEARLIRDVHSHIYLNEAMFKEILAKPDTSILHVNTCFNSATMFASEDLQAFKTVNCDSLAKIAQYVYADIAVLLKEETVLKELQGEKEDSFQQRCQWFVCLADEIKRIKTKIKNQDGNHQLDRIASIENMISIQEENSLLAKSQPAESPSLFESNDQDSILVKTQDLSAQRDKIKSALPTQLNELNELLLAKQEEVEKCLPLLKTSVIAAIMNLETQKQVKSTPGLEKALLILQVYDQILTLQLKLPGYSPLSRSTEVELFLLLYRLLDIKPIIICWSGLDRSGAVRALADSQAQMEREFFIDCFAKKEEKNSQTEFAARIEACGKLYRLIVNLDKQRDELFSLTNVVLSQFKGTIGLVSDLNDFEQSSKEEPTLNLRTSIFAKVDEMHPPASGNKGSDLKSTQRYLELVAGHLLGTEAEKTLFSTGVVGLKYLHDTYWPKNYFANPHPLDRWPLFCLIGNKPVKLLDFSEGWVYNSLTITPAAIAIFLRLSQLRGN